MKLLALCGSLRQQSTNAALLRHVGKMLPAGTQMQTAGFAELPLYNEELDQGQHPAPVRALRDQVEAADALIIATPEYNYSVPGGLKNAIDWLSRPAFNSPLTGKPVVVLSSSPAGTGGARAQGHLKQILTGTLSPTYPGMEFNLGASFNYIDENGSLGDEKTRQKLRDFVHNFSRWLEQITATNQ